VDEASMVSDKKNPSTSNAVFGEGDLLGDLFQFDAKGKFIFVGDPCQLPPVNQKESPALHAGYLRDKYKMEVEEYNLTEIFRQEEENGILKCAFMLRKLWQSSLNDQSLRPLFVPLPLKGFQNITVYPSELNLVNQYINTVKAKGYDYASLICNSNKECNYLSLYVREAIHGKQGCIIVGDLLLVTQNNYVVDLVNGDLVVVKWIGEREHRADLWFVKVEVEELSSKKSYRLLLIEDLLINGQANVDVLQHKKLIIDFAKRMRERNIKTKTGEFFDMMLNDPYLNALRTTYGYALTCHKSQGGEWNEVFLYLQKSLYARRGSELYQWAYTAVTRAKKTLHIEDNWLVK
jgi:ATP-dependent exoDNAse (exonuclease V) alpha subunit